ncbi:MAG: DUF2075 domain-containing protein [Acidobacteria bacterium]|nr:DUF2075 domain-containing protein [Acidobacteriota bacterium]
MAGPGSSPGEPRSPSSSSWRTGACPPVREPSNVAEPRVRPRVPHLRTLRERGAICLRIAETRDGVPEKTRQERAVPAPYWTPVASFLAAPSDTILGRLARGSAGSIEGEQQNAWEQAIPILRTALAPGFGALFLEFEVPRRASRVDAVWLAGSAVFPIEFKCGATGYLRADLDQAWDYALDLKNFHRGSRKAAILPILVATHASWSDTTWPPPHADGVRVSVDPVQWFLHPVTDTRSSNYLEDAATEFQVQGLELDWTCVTWDADLRSAADGWEHRSFRGDAWTHVRQPERRQYLLNAYRVLLTRARQGMVLFIPPPGDPTDRTRPPGVYDRTFEYLARAGIETVQGRCPRHPGTACAGQPRSTDAAPGRPGLLPESPAPGSIVSWQARTSEDPSTPWNDTFARSRG